MAIIRMLDDRQALAAVPALAEILVDSVEGGASVGFMKPYSIDDARTFWQGTSEAVARGETLLFVAEVEGRIAGTVQVGFAVQPNQPHRGDLKKLLVHRSARGLGLSRLLMQAAEAGAVEHGRTLLVLDTATGSDAEKIYPRFGWERVGVIPDYALWPDGGFCATTLFYKRVA